MATQVGSLYTSLTLESSSFIANAKRSADAADRMAAQMDKAFAIAKASAVAFAAGALGAVTAEFGNAVKGALDYADAISDLAARTGASAKTLQEFRFAAQLSGSSVDDADAAVAKFARTLGEAQTGGKAQLDLFDRLGVKVRNADGSYRSLDDVLKDFADGVAKLPTVQQQNAATLEAMGKSAGSLTALLGQGAKGFNALSAEAAKYGIVLDTEVLSAAGPVNDQLDTLKMILDAQFAQSVLQNADALMQAAVALTELAVGGAKAITYLADLKRGFSEVQRTEGFAAAMLTDFDDLAARGEQARKVRNILLTPFDPNANGLPGSSRPPPAATGGGSRGAAGPGGRAVRARALPAVDPRLEGLDPTSRLNAINPLDYEMSGLGRSLVDLEAYGVRLDEVAGTAARIAATPLISEDEVRSAEQFAGTLTAGLSQAVIFGRDLKDVVKGIAAEILSSGLLNLVSGGRYGTSFADSLAGLGSILGFADGGRPPVGRVSVVGERGREWFVPDQPGTIIPNHVVRQIEAGIGSGRGGATERLLLDVQPNELFTVRVVEGATLASRAETASQLRRAGQRQLYSSGGA